MSFFIIEDIPVLDNFKKIESMIPIEQPYIPVPNSYNEQKWPRYTNMPCYFCNCTSKRRPFFCPQKRDIMNGKLIRGNSPIYCHPMCAVAHLQNMKLDQSSYNKYIGFIKELLYVMTNIEINIILPAEDKIVLKKFGGSKTDHEYQRELIELSKEYVAKLYTDLEDYYLDNR